MNGLRRNDVAMETNAGIIKCKQKNKSEVNVLIFGQIADITGSTNLAIDDIKDTDQLVQQLTNSYPGLAGAKYAIAVDKKIIKENTTLNASNTVALLPPFSGG
jgi:molybdopterin converting factor small subunit